ncbi:MAG: ABC transporter ATP-binding protein [Clostridiales bacterium]|nr:ABC transporter ATP-binding protein [Clostridiales bacterium]
MSILTIQNLSKSFGGITAVSDVNLALECGELVGLIGPNGAGKTTVFNLLTGVYTPTGGEIRLGDLALQGKKPHYICGKGVARTFQNIRLFKNMTVLNNVRTAMHQHAGYGTLSSLLHLGRYHSEEQDMETRAAELLDRLGLGDKADELAGNLSYGEQRHLEIARALATEPVLLLLDEPAAGMNPAETLRLTRLLHDIRQQFNLTMLLIEHDMSLVMNICERIYVLDYGCVIASGSPADIRRDSRVIKAYLGEEAGHV